MEGKEGKKEWDKKDNTGTILRMSQEAKKKGGEEWLTKNELTVNQKTKEGGKVHKEGG